MGTILRRHAVAVALLAGVLVAGCATQPAVPPTPTPSPSEQQGETPSPIATPSRLPQLEELVITSGGIGSLRVGEPVSGTDMIVYDPNFCAPLDPGDAVTNPDGTPIEFGRWVANYPTENGAGAPFNAHVHEGVVTVIEVRNDILATAEGVRVGSSLDELTSAYPSLAPGEEGPISKSLLLATPEGDMVFEVAIPSDYQGYAPDTVINIRIFPPGQHNLKLVAASDDVVGGCI